MIHRLPLLAALVAGLLAACGGSDSEPAPQPVACADLSKLALPNTTIASAANAPAGTFSPATGVTLTEMPAFCRVVGTSTPSNDSSIGFEVWIPQGSAWNGKYLQVGTIGYAGSYQYAQMATVLKRGYAVASTDTGHPTAFGFDTSWAPGHPEKIIDWGYRAHKETTDKAKALIRAHTTVAPKYSYFSGASNGGREALMAAQRYPQDFDGYLVDGPAISWPRMAAGWVWTERAVITDVAGAIPTAKRAAIQAAVVAACDTTGGGIADGVVDDPRQCSFDPGTMLCTGAETDSCLTAPQIASLRKIMDGPRNSSGARLFPGLDLGGMGDFSWQLYVTGPIPGLGATSGHAILGNAFFSNMVYETGAAFDPATFDFGSGVALAESKVIKSETLSAVVGADSTDYSGLRSRPARILMYTGWEDPVVPPRAVIDYYERIIEAKSLGADLAATQSRFRFFIVPGVSHLQGGPGADAFGALWGKAAPTVDRQHDVLSALEAWVEQGIAPDSIIATKYVNDDSTAGVARTRPLCPYPKLAQYSGSGSTNDAANFACVDGPRGAYLN